MTNKRLVLTIVASLEEAKKIAYTLVERQLAACVNIIPEISSIYRWKGKVEEAEEYLLLIKTTAEAFPSLCEAIQQLHPYEVPECLALNIDGGSENYLSWISDSVTKQ
jgi:periplasmic divalent cation tolerance protein